MAQFGRLLGACLVIVVVSLALVVLGLNTDRPAKPKQEPRILEPVELEVRRVGAGRRQSTERFELLVGAVRRRNDDGSVRSITFHGDGIVSLGLAPMLPSEKRTWANRVADLWAKTDGSGLPVWVNVVKNGETIMTVRRN